VRVLGAPGASVSTHKQTLAALNSPNTRLTPFGSGAQLPNVRLSAAVKCRSRLFRLLAAKAFEGFPIWTQLFECRSMPQYFMSASAGSKYISHIDFNPAA